MNENVLVLFIFSIKRGKTEEFINSWNRGVELLVGQEGWVDERLLQSHDDPHVFVSLIEWKDANKFKDAVTVPEFQEVMNTLPVREEVTLSSYMVTSKNAKRMAA